MILKYFVKLNEHLGEQELCTLNIIQLIEQKLAWYNV